MSKRRSALHDITTALQTDSLIDALIVSVSSVELPNILVRRVDDTISYDQFTTSAADMHYDVSFVLSVTALTHIIADDTIAPLNQSTAQFLIYHDLQCNDIDTIPQESLP